MRANQKIKIKNYSSRIPQWKKIDQEIQQLTKQYQQVIFLNLYHVELFI
jgi:hypothetical protein